MKLIVPMQMRVNGQLVQAAGRAAGTSCIQGSCHPCLPLQPGEIVKDNDGGRIDMVESHVAYNATKSLAILAFPCNQVVKFRYFSILMGLIF